MTCIHNTEKMYTIPCNVGICLTLYKFVFSLVFFQPSIKDNASEKVNCNQPLQLFNTETQLYICFEVVFSPKQGQVIHNIKFALQVLIMSNLYHSGPFPCLSNSNLEIILFLFHTSMTGMTYETPPLLPTQTYPLLVHNHLSLCQYHSSLNSFPPSFVPTSDVIYHLLLW